jgi:glycosyltransferase involved in cell wall biosynthesis
MRIAIVAPVEEAIPPRAYGGIELMAHLIAEGLVARGHDVMLLATADSQTSGTLIPLADAPWRTEVTALPPEAVTRAKEAAIPRALRILTRERPDAVHNHLWRLLPHRADVAAPMVTTMHHALDVPVNRRRYGRGSGSRLVAISEHQRRCMPELPHVSVINNAVDAQRYPFAEGRGGYLAFLGRVSPEKGLDTAIEVAARTGLALRIAAKIGSDRDFFDARIRPRIDGHTIEYVGELGLADKAALLSGAVALLHPARFSDPCPIAPMEAMACGTPVIGLARGGVPEVVRDGVTGFVVQDLDEMVTAVDRLPALSRRACREHVELHFDAGLMVQRYERLLTAMVCG